MEWLVIVGTFLNIVVYGVLGFAILSVLFWPGLFISSFIINLPKIMKSAFQSVGNINLSPVGATRAKIDKQLVDE